jgi:hypothetical protein
LPMPPELTAITGRAEVMRFFATVPAGGRHLRAAGMGGRAPEASSLAGTGAGTFASLYGRPARARMAPVSGHRFEVAVEERHDAPAGIVG